MTPRTLAGITAAARKAPCLCCGADPLENCAALGTHVARVAEAYREKLITGPELLAVTDSLPALTWDFVIPDLELAA